MKFAPIILFVYNRPWHTKQTLEALMLNNYADQSTLYIYCDGPKEDALQVTLKNIKEVRAVIREKKWCKEVIIKERTENLGLANNITTGISEVIDEFGRVIVLEDDIVTSIGFLSYMNDALNFYKDNEKVMHISGYFPNVKRKLPDFFFYNQTSCWGWATWKRSWLNFSSNSYDLYNSVLKSNRIYEFNINDSYPFFKHLELNLKGEMKTWAIKWHTSVFLKRGLCLHPNKSFVQNIGFDNSGVNCGVTERYSIENLNDKKFIKPKKLIENMKARRAMVEFNENKNVISLFKRIKRKIKKILNYNNLISINK